MPLYYPLFVSSQLEELWVPTSRQHAFVRYQGLTYSLISRALWLWSDLFLVSSSYLFSWCDVSNWSSYLPRNIPHSEAHEQISAFPGWSSFPQIIDASFLSKIEANDNGQVLVLKFECERGWWVSKRSASSVSACHPHR
jgi:hypothetical protein